MEQIKTKYISPITVEAEIFLNSLETLSQTHNNIDAVLLSSLEKIMNAIDKFLDSTASEIVETKNTELVKLEKVGQIKRIFSCTTCKQDIGKCVEKVALHLTTCSEFCHAERVSSEVIKAGRIKIESNAAEERSVQNSSKEKREERNCKRKPPREPRTKVTKKTRSLLTTNLSQFIEDQNKISEKLKCIPAYARIEDHLLSLIKPLFPNKSVKIYKFGSRIAGIANRDSDLDLFIDIGETFNIFQNRAGSATLDKLHKVAKAFVSGPRFWKGLKVVDRARVPVLKIIHAETGIDCDINFSNSLGIVNTKLLEYILNLQPIAHSLCSFMKIWLKRTRFCNEMNSYSMILIVLFYLQTLNLIPSLEVLQENINEEKAFKVGQWICTYATPTLKELNISAVRVDQPNLLKYLRQFFVFYRSFDFDKYVISPFIGKTIKRSDVELCMPSRYAEFVKNNPDYPLQLDKPMVVQDPFQLNYNTTKSVSECSLKTLKLFIINSLDILNDHFLDDVY